MKPDFFDYRHLGFGYLILLAAAFVLVPATVIAAWCDPRQFAFSYLFAFTFYFTVAVGSLFWVMVHHATDAEWSVVLRRWWEHGAGLLAPLAVLFIPFVFVAPELWTWMGAAHDPLVQKKALFLNPSFFWLRAALYFAVLVCLAVSLKSFSIAQDTTGDARCTVWNRRLACGGAPFFALAVTFSSVDWLMGLDFRWYSTMWGVYLVAGAILCALCVTLLGVTALRRAGHLDVVTLDHYQLLGRLLLAFSLLWAYIAYSQYMLVWYTNIPEETAYFALRNTGSWRGLSTALVVGHFLLPFLLLLPHAVKRRPAVLCGIAGWILLLHALDIYLMVLPVLHPEGFRPRLLDLLSLMVIGVLLALVLLRNLGKASLYPSRDPRLPGSLYLRI